MTLFSPPTISSGSCYSQLSLARVYTLQATSLFPSHALPAHFRCAPHPYSALDSQNLRARSCALVSLALLVKPDQVSLGGHPFSRLQGTHPLHRCRQTNSLHRLVASTNLFAYWVYAAISWLSCMGWIGCSLKKVTDLVIHLAISTVIVSDSITEGLQTYIVSGVHLPPAQHTLQTPLLIIHRAHLAVCKH